MTDGTTGIQVAPTAEEINMAQSVFQKAADAIVGLSTLKASVDALAAQVAQMADELDRLRKQNAGLEESLYQARNHRHELEAKLATATSTQADAESQRKVAQDECDRLAYKLDHTLANLDEARTDRDKAELKVLELEDALKVAQSKLDKLAEIFGKAPEAVQQTATTLNPVPEPMQVQPSAPEPLSVEVNWSLPYHWDAALGRYVND